MKQRPILFSAPMIRAILEGRKTQTRRIAKPGRKPSLLDGTWTDDYVLHEGNHEWLMRDCLYGKPGDQLWVRETFYAYGYWLKNENTGHKWRFIDITLQNGLAYCYEDNVPDTVQTRAKSKGGIGWYKRPSIFIPRAASRITIEITSIRVERLQDINEWDAIDEGLEMVDGPDGLRYYGNYGDDNCDTCLPPVESYRTLWQYINGSESWEQNPWVWVIEYKKL